MRKATILFALTLSSCGPSHPSRQLVAQCLLQADNRFANDGSDTDQVGGYVTTCLQAHGYQPITVGKDCTAPDASVNHACSS